MVNGILEFFHDLVDEDDDSGVALEGPGSCEGAALSSTCEGVDGTSEVVVLEARISVPSAAALANAATFFFSSRSFRFLIASSDMALPPPALSFVVFSIYAICVDMDLYC